MNAAASPAPRSEYFQQSIPFIELLGLKRESAVAGRSRLSLELRPELRNMYAAFHGGVIMTMLDVAMAGAAVSSRNYEYKQRHHREHVHELPQPGQRHLGRAG